MLPPSPPPPRTKSYLCIERGTDLTRRFVSVGADDPRNAHLWALAGAAERLTMLQVDLLDRASLRAAFDGCDGVIHTASPMHDNPV
jgi:nucleoside-diphosphate-sugar epimerase